MPGLTAEQYDSWYRTPRGRWIGQLEYRLLLRLLRPGPEESILDVGCGTGYFTRRFARNQMAAVTGVDTDPEAIGYARLHAANRESYLVGSGEELPFPVGAFDLSVSIATYAGEGLLAESAALSKGLNGPVRKRCGQIRSSSITAPTCA
jgi:SAM-dependent methyltransferase